MDAATDEKRKLQPKFEIKDIGPCKLEISVELGADVVKREIEAKYKELSDSAELPGFRRGHAPRPILERKYGKALLEDLKFELLNSTFEEIKEEKHLDPIGEPDVDVEKIELKDGAPLAYKVTVEVKPKVELKTYLGLPLKRIQPKVEDQDVEEELLALREARAELVPAEAGAEKRDQLTYDYDLLVDGTSRETGANQALFLTETVAFHGVQLPEFHLAFVGRKAGDRVDVGIQLPQDHPDADLKGKQGVLRVTVKGVKRRKLPELDAAFAKAMDMDSIDELKADLRKQILRGKEREAKAEEAKSLLDHLIRENPFPMPEGLIAANEHEHLHRLRTRLLLDGVEEADVEKEMAEHTKTARPEIERSLRERFILEHVAVKEKIFVTEEQIDERVTEMATRSGHHPAEMRSFLENQGMIPHLRRTLREEAVLDFLVSKAKAE